MTNTTDQTTETHDNPASIEELIAARDAFKAVASRYKGELCFACIINDGGKTLIDAGTSKGDFDSLRRRATWLACVGHIRAAANVFEDERCRESGLAALHATTIPSPRSIADLIRNLSDGKEEEA